MYASERIPKGIEIEVCQLIILDFSEVGKKLEGYVFDFDPTRVALALGNGSLYNHSDEPNAVAYMDKKKQLLSFETLRAISKDEEITINYGYTEEERKRFHIV